MEKRNIWLALIILFVGVVGGAFAYHYVEGWSVLDSFYFVVITVTTIGYGDFFPVTNIGKIFTIFYAFFGVAIAFYILSMISSSIFKKHVESKVSEIKSNVKKEKEMKEEVSDVIKKAIRKRR